MCSMAWCSSFSRDCGERRVSGDTRVSMTNVDIGNPPCGGKAKFAPARAGPGRRRPSRARVSEVMTEMPVPGVPEQGLELLPAHPNHVLVIAGLEVDLRLLHKAVVQNRLDSVRRAERRNGADIAVAEKLRDLALRRQPQDALHRVMHLTERH